MEKAISYDEYRGLNTPKLPELNSREKSIQLAVQTIRGEQLAKENQIRGMSQAAQAGQVIENEQSLPVIENQWQESSQSRRSPAQKL